MLEFPLWVVVANASRARILLRERASSPLLLREERQHAAGRMHPLAQERTPHGQTIGGRSGLALRTPLRDGASDQALLELMSGVWRTRSDRYSEQRYQLRQSKAEKVEMFHIGG